MTGMNELSVSITTHFISAQYASPAIHDPCVVSQYIGYHLGIFGESSKRNRPSKKFSGQFVQEKVWLELPNDWIACTKTINEHPCVKQLMSPSCTVILKPSPTGFLTHVLNRLFTWVCMIVAISLNRPCKALVETPRAYLRS
jgi:hypothetical protein